MSSDRTALPNLTVITEAMVGIRSVAVGIWVYIAQAVLTGPRVMGVVGLFDADDVERFL